MNGRHTTEQISCFEWSGDHRALHSFPTRRSSDLDAGMGKSSLDWPPRHTIRSPSQCQAALDRKSTRLNSSHVAISYAVFCLKKKKYSTRDGFHLVVGLSVVYGRLHN